MFARKKEGWFFFDSKRNSWMDSGCKKPGAELFDLSNNFVNLSHQASMLPVFSGSKILCVGRNYRKHSAELGNDVPDRPLWFSKPPSAIIGHGEKVILPQGYGRIDYEGELVLVIGRRCSRVSIAEAPAYIGGVTGGFDITARDLQKSDGQWTRAKGFDTFLPLASIVAPYSEEWCEAELEVRLNGDRVQYSSIAAMVFGFAELVADISACMTLEPGDLIMTGTPEGIGPVKAGDHLQLKLSGPCEINLEACCGI